MIENLQYLWIIWLIVAGNYLGELTTCSVRELLTHNIFFKYIIGILTCYFFIVLPDSKYDTSRDVISQIKKSIEIFTLFILLTRQTKIMSILNVGLIMSIHVLKKLIENSNIKEDIEKNKKRRDILQKITLATIIIGFLGYVGKVYYEYEVFKKIPFRWSKFLGSVSTCTGDNVNMNNITFFEFFIMGIKQVLLFYKKI